ncbi:hypothetical protein U9M48_000191 [Paspalum notatum var. saurae]|uniref:Reverse transcriptase domain-containing protein n=1 Tax=Paspalum notatum var. saurae TaxID=547442 RepID=A0AAQ3SFT3_PASNO
MAFLLGRNIMERAVILHETLHELHKKKQNGIVFKVDFEKAYDKVRWDFLQQTLRMKGLSPKWCSWVQSFVQQGNVGVKVNDQVGSYFQTKKEFVKYADDTVIFLEHDIEQAKNLKLLLCTFEQLSGLKINFHKREVFCFGQAKQQEEAYSHLFGCSLGSFPFRYLGIPMHYRKLSNKDWALVEDRFEKKKLSGWKGKLLSIGGRLVLINFVLSSLPMFMLFFFKVPKGVLQKMDYCRSKFYWQNDQHRKKYRLARSEILCQPKDQGGLGILNPNLQNKCLLSKWHFKLCNEDGQVEKRPGDSLLVGPHGDQMTILEDTWLGNQPLKLKYHSLFNIVRNKHATVAEKSVVERQTYRLASLVLRVSDVTLQEKNDVFIWDLRRNGSFSVRSMYKYLVNSNVSVPQDI